jgi:hypothetical protein
MRAQLAYGFEALALRQRSEGGFQETREKVKHRKRFLLGKAGPTLGTGAARP